MTLKMGLVLVSLHIITTLVTLGFNPGACDPGEIGCGDTALRDVAMLQEDQADAGGFLSGVKRIASGIGSVILPFLNLITFNPPWLSADGLPDLAKFIKQSAHVVFGLLHGWIIFSLLKDTLGRFF